MGHLPGGHLVFLLIISLQHTLVRGLPGEPKLSRWLTLEALGRLSVPRSFILLLGLESTSTWWLLGGLPVILGVDQARDLLLHVGVCVHRLLVLIGISGANGLKIRRPTRLRFLI